MAVFSALKNKKNQRLREGLEDLALKCGEVTEKDEVNVEIDSVVRLLEQFNIKLSEKELTKFQKISESDGKIPKEEFVACAKNCSSIKEFLDKVGRDNKSPAVRAETVKVDQASLAFKAIDKDNSGYVDREEFLQFTSNLPAAKQEKLLKKIDKDGDGKISLAEFRHLFDKK